MKYVSNRIRKAFYLPITALFLLLGFMPLQSVHAQSITMNHNMGTPTSTCAGPCGNAPVVLKENQKAPAREQEDEPEPPQILPQYTQFNAFAVPKKLASSYLGGERVPRPPDLVILYANLRF